MGTKNLKGNGIIRTARIEIDVPHLEEIITFGLPLAGPNYYQAVMDKITQEGMLRPTTAQTFSLIDLALQNPDEEHCKDILSRLRSNWLWTSTENLYTPNEVIVYDNVDGNMPSDKKSLLKRFKDGDKSVRVVPYGFKKESQSVSELAKNSYVIAQVGNKDFVEDVVARVAERISRNEPYVWALDPVNVNEDIKRYSALGSGWGDDGLVVGGCHDGRGGCAFGVCKKSAEGTAKNK